MTREIWRKSYDQGLEDLDPKLFETTFTQEMRHTFTHYPNVMALEFLGIEMTFKQLDELSNKLAHVLLQNGLVKGDRVGINLPNTPQYMIALLGTLKAGCIVSGVSPLLSDEQMRYQLDDLGAKALVTLDAIFEARVLKIIDKLPELQVIIATSIGDYLPKIKQVLGKALGKIPKGKVTPLPGKTVLNYADVMMDARYSTDLPKDTATPDDLAYIQYTGGTTGLPKGAMITHRNAVSDVIITQKWVSWEKGKGVAISGFPFFHIAGLYTCESCIILGWPQLLIPNPRDTDQICKVMGKYRPTMLAHVPSLFQMLLKNPKFAQLDHSRVENCVTAAAPFPVESQKKLEEAVGKGKLLELYGMTETSPVTTMNPAKGERRLGSIGLPLPNTDIKLINPETGKEVAIGEPGEICVKGPMVMKGYWNKPEETKNVIDSNGYMHTGDVAVFSDDGYLNIVDRLKDMIIVGGYKVFSSKVEEVIVKHPAIDTVALIGVPNPERPGSEIVKAFVLLAPGTLVDDENVLKNEIQSYLKDKLAPYEIPKIIEFRKELPLTTVGKVDKKELRKQERGG
ncbi:MAG: AMP-binding protein [Candidatus Lokiarchaeota archaeon]|nr:AMP-binding protein [Candidatus Lokiarchaeota archaeon]